MPTLINIIELWHPYLVANAAASRILLMVATASLLFCTAVNCYTYRLAYPLWQWVGLAEFKLVHKNYLRLLTPVITVPHVVMFFSTAALIYKHPACIPLGIIVIVFFCTTVVIGISITGAGPIHSCFERSGKANRQDLSRLSTISAVRSGLLLGASIILLSAIAHGLQP